MKIREASIDSEKINEVIDYFCEMVANPENFKNMSNEQMDNYMGSKIKQQLIDLNLIEPVKRNKKLTIDIDNLTLNQAKQLSQLLGITLEELANI